MASACTLPGSRNIVSEKSDLLHHRRRGDGIRAKRLSPSSSPISLVLRARRSRASRTNVIPQPSSKPRTTASAVLRKGLGAVLVAVWAALATAELLGAAAAAAAR